MPPRLKHHLDKERTPDRNSGAESTDQLVDRFDAPSFNAHALGQADPVELRITEAQRRRKVSQQIC